MARVVLSEREPLEWGLSAGHSGLPWCWGENMAVKQQAKESDKTPKPESGGKKTKEGRTKRESKAEMIENMIQQTWAKLKEKDSKATLGEFIRLLQLQREIEEDSPKEVRVTWVETAAAEESVTET